MSALLLGGCAPHRDPWGLAVRRGAALDTSGPGDLRDRLELPALPAAPDSLQAELTVAPREPGAPPFTVRVYARPHHAYRIDAIGFPSMIAASYLWQDGRWMWIRHDRRQVREGSGDQLELEESALRLPDVHAVLGFLWGRALPGFETRDSLLPPGPEGEVRWKAGSQIWSATLDPRTGLCREARSEEVALRYGAYARRDGRWIPGAAEIFVDGESVFLLGVRDLNASPSWRKNPFALTVPVSYDRR